MDFGVGFLSNNVMLPILDLLYGIVPSYGLAIVALTLVIRLALFPLGANSIRSMRKMKVVQPLMQKRMQEIKERNKDNPTKQQEEMLQVQKEFGNPLAGCFPLLLQMPVLIALFGVLRGSPFADVTYPISLQILPQAQLEQVQPQVYTTPPKNIYTSEGVHYPIVAVLPPGNNLVVGQKTKLEFQDVSGKPLSAIVSEVPDDKFIPHWKVISGQERVQLNDDGTLEALQPGKVTIQGIVPGLATDKGFLFISALGRVGAFDRDGTVHWDIVGMVLFFGVSLYFNQILAGQGTKTSNPQQDTVNKITPLIVSGVFFISPLPAGVLMYMIIANIIQSFQTFIISREPLPENLQKIVEIQEKEEKKETGRQTLPFERSRSKKKASS